MNSKIKHALTTLSPTLADYLAPIVLAEQFDATLSSQQWEQLLAKSELEDAALRLALLPVAAAYSYAPLSNFYVGAIVRGLSGRLYFGANVEFTGVQLGQTIHAEQAAISHAWMKGEEGITDITVNFSPCGHCRQFMNELTTAKTLKVQLPQLDERLLQTYLPDSFGPLDLGITSGLMTKVDHHKTSQETNPLVLSALNALNSCHAPYTHNLSGVAVQLTTGEVYQGAYAENAAFNPSLPPLQVALVQVLMDGKSFKDIAQAALVETKNNPISHFTDTQATLEAIHAEIKLSYLTV